MLRGLTYLRYRRIVHGNIKASNVFRDPATGLGILGDFRLPGVQTFNELAKEISSKPAWWEISVKNSVIFQIWSTLVCAGMNIKLTEKIKWTRKFELDTKPEASLHYMSPELLLSEGAAGSPKSDLWAMAATICQLMTRLPPHSQMSRKELEVRLLEALSPGLFPIRLNIAGNLGPSVRSSPVWHLTFVRTVV